MSEQLGYCPVCDANRAGVGNGSCADCFNHLLKVECNPVNLAKHRGYDPKAKRFKTKNEVLGLNYTSDDWRKWEY